MKTVPLHGKIAAGRVALIDDGDYDLVMQHRWYVDETAKVGKRHWGPYAVTRIRLDGGRRIRLPMHCLIMGTKGVDHRDHDGLNNQRSNLRPATQVQNGQNQRPQVGKSSRYKGVSWYKASNAWRARLRVNKTLMYLGSFASELEAAYAYDAAAREAFGEFACTNFPGAPTQAMRDEWEAATRARVAHAEQALERVCVVCGKGYRSKSPKPNFYCGRTCCARAARERKREREGLPEPGTPRKLTCIICGKGFESTRSDALYCGTRCCEKARRQRERERELEGRLF